MRTPFMVESILTREGTSGTQPRATFPKVRREIIVPPIETISA